ncbi:MAG TPA: hypothetical protein VE110_08175 [Gemmatimonadaceae bacterium]|nr:hypothetical protein [Gemmatimonadaceae bacterium]
MNDPGTELTATADVRMLVADRLGVTTTVSSWGTTAVSTSPRVPVCAVAGEERSAVNNVTPAVRHKILDDAAINKNPFLAQLDYAEETPTSGHRG